MVIIINVDKQCFGCEINEIFTFVRFWPIHIFVIKKCPILFLPKRVELGGALI